MLLFQSLRMLITLACPNNCCALVHARLATLQECAKKSCVWPYWRLLRGEELRMRVMAPPLTQQREGKQILKGLCGTNVTHRPSTITLRCQDHRGLDWPSLPADAAAPHLAVCY